MISLLRRGSGEMPARGSQPTSSAFFSGRMPSFLTSQRDASEMQRTDGLSDPHFSRGGPGISPAVENASIPL